MMVVISAVYLHLYLYVYLYLYLKRQQCLLYALPAGGVYYCSNRVVSFFTPSFSKYIALK